MAIPSTPDGSTGYLLFALLLRQIDEIVVVLLEETVEFVAACFLLLVSAETCLRLPCSSTSC